MNFREFQTSAGATLILGKDSKSNDELVAEYEGKENIILHTVTPGSPFCVIGDLNPSKEDIKEAAVVCASKSQDWRDNKTDVKVSVFDGKSVKKKKKMKEGTWGVKKRKRTILVKKKEIEKWLSQ